ncbi:MAG: permease-like cell division protein FtsX, partial [Pseudomonadota bacterium]
MSLTEQPGRGNPVAGWLAQHGRTLGATIGRMARAPLATLLSVLVISITLALPAGLHLAVKNTLRLSGGWERATDFSVFLAADIAEADGRQLAAIIAKRADVAAVDFVHKDEALEDFRGHAGFSEVLDGLQQNPLPHALVVRPAELADAATIAVLKTDLANLPETDLVQLDTEWIERFRAVLALIERGVLTAAVLLALAVVVVIGNTIRLDIQ